MNKREHERQARRLNTLQNVVADLEEQSSMFITMLEMRLDAILPLLRQLESARYYDVKVRLTRKAMKLLSTR